MLVIENDMVKKEVTGIIDKLGRDRSQLIPILHEVQNKYRHVPADAMQTIAEAMGISAVDVHGVVSFYTFLDTNPKGKYTLRISNAISDMMAGAQDILEEFENELGIKVGQTTADDMFTLEWTADIGLCDQSPSMLVNDKAYGNLTAEKVKAIIAECKAGEPKGDFILNSCRGKFTFGEVEDNAGLKMATKLSGDEIINMITASGLRGRGGAGFPTGLKLKLTAGNEDKERYIVCNADEGEPGTYKDRVILAEYAHTVFEGMTIAARAVGAKEGMVYLRAEYLYLRDAMESALNDRRKQNLLGAAICGVEGFDFDIRIQMGAGAYICGEETALIESLEGFRGEPRNRPPFPAAKGYKGHPTAVNNVTTFGWIPCILAKGADWFKAIGTEQSTGPKLFSVSGDVKNPGVYEFPFGTTIEDLLKAVGGEDAKAVQVGGASGSTIAASEFGRAMSFEDVPTGGSIIVFGPKRNMLDVALNFVEFFAHESCGQCTPCRNGNGKLIRGIKMLKNGTATEQQIKDLVSLGETMQIIAKCGLGQTSPNAFISIINLFGHEFMPKSAAAE